MDELEGCRLFSLADGWEILVGRSAEDNDRLSLRIGHPSDFWFHVAGQQGSHVLARHPERPSQISREAKRVAAGLAVYFSKARNAGKVTVHMARCGDVSKPRGYPPGKVLLKSHQVIHTHPLDPAQLQGEPHG